MLHILHCVGVLVVQANTLGILRCAVKKLLMRAMDPTLHARCSESDRQPEAHALLDEIVQPAPGYGRHSK
jgi:hypothetical protein